MNAPVETLDLSTYLGRPVHDLIRAFPGSRRVQMEGETLKGVIFGPGGNGLRPFCDPEDVIEAICVDPGKYPYAVMGIERHWGRDEIRLHLGMPASAREAGVNQGLQEGPSDLYEFPQYLLKIQYGYSAPHPVSICLWKMSS